MTSCESMLICAIIGERAYKLSGSSRERTAVCCAVTTQCSLSRISNAQLALIATLQQRSLACWIESGATCLFSLRIVGYSEWARARDDALFLRQPSTRMRVILSVSAAEATSPLNYTQGSRLFVAQATYTPHTYTRCSLRSQNRRGKMFFFAKMLHVWQPKKWSWFLIGELRYWIKIVK